MNEKEFDKKWKEAKEFGDDVKGYTKQLIDLMEKENLSEEWKGLFINLFSEVDALIEWLSDEKLEKDTFEAWHKRKYLNHIHQNGKIYVPETEVDDC